MKMVNQKPSLPTANDEDSFDVKQLLLSYLAHWKWFVFSLFVTLSIAFVVNKLTPAVYRTMAKFLIKEESNAMNLFDFSAIGADGILPKGQKVANETIILKSRAIASEVLDRLPFDVEYYEEGIFTDYQLYKNAPITVEVDWKHAQLVNTVIEINWANSQSFEITLPESSYMLYTPGKDVTSAIETPVLSKSIYAFGDVVEFPFARFRVTFTGALTEGKTKIKLRDRESLLFQYTGESLQIAPVDKIGSILTLSIETSNPRKGADYLNTLMQTFLDNELEEKNSIATNTVNFIDSQLSGISDSLNYSENRLEEFRSTNKTVNITTEGTTMFEKLSELEKALSEQKFKKEYYRNLEAYLVREDYSEIVVPSGLGIDDPVLNRLIEQLISLQADKSRFLATQTESSPTVQEVTRKIHDLNTSIKEVLKNVSLNASLLITDLEKRIYKIESQFGRLPETEQNLINIKRRYSLNENIYNFLLQRRAEAAISLASNRPANKIIELAVLNFLPLRLKPLLNFFLAFLMGFLIPIAIITARDMFAVRIKELKDIEQKLRAPVVGFIGKNTKYPPLFVLKHPRAGITEAFRTLRTNLNFIYPKDKPLALMVTSNIASEGKSFCSMNLASVYSVGAKKTLLVGCDLHKKFNFNDFNVPNNQGLSTYLSHQSNNVYELIQKTEYANLDILVPGPIPPVPSELLMSDRFEQMVSELKTKYDVIILDSPPIGLTNETMHLTRIVDITLFVLRQNYSLKSFVDEINKLKDKKGIRNVYSVFNDVDEKYLSHSGYGYGYYAEDDNKKKNGIGKMFSKTPANTNTNPPA